VRVAVDRADSERLKRHPLPQSTLHSPLFAGVEPAVVGFEVVVFVLVANVSQLALLPLALTGLALGTLHLVLALATARDRRLTLVFARSIRHPRLARPWPTLASRPAQAEPTFPRRVLT